jgi:heme O synthase-like polyprenyltransferase
MVYLAGAVVFGVAILGLSIAFFFDRSNRMAMRLFMGSNLYLVVVMTMFVISARS